MWIIKYNMNLYMVEQCRMHSRFNDHFCLIWMNISENVTMLKSMKEINSLGILVLYRINFWSYKLLYRATGSFILIIINNNNAI